MGYLGNHLATVATGVFAAVLTVLWPVFVDFAPVLDFVFIMAVPIMWFLVFTCWIAQKSADYMHSTHHHDQNDDVPAGTVLQYDEKKSLTVTATAGGSHKGAQSEIADLQSVQSELAADLEGLKESLKLKDSEIERLNRQIANLQTLVQIETLKAELANLKMLASKHKK